MFILLCRGQGNRPDELAAIDRWLQTLYVETDFNDNVRKQCERVYYRNGIRITFQLKPESAELGLPPSDLLTVTQFFLFHECIPLSLVQKILSF